MSLLIATSIGIREQNTLALIFVAQFTTMMLGLLTELYSRPVIRQDKTSYAIPVANAPHLLSRDVWECDRPIRDDDGKVVTPKRDYR